MAPVATGLFIYHMQAMDGNVKVDWNAFSSKLVLSLSAAYKLWPIAHTINFGLIPNHYRVLYINLVAIGWNSILSTITSGEANSNLEDTGKIQGPLPAIPASS